MTHPKKLIEVALPLDAINQAAPAKNPSATAIPVPSTSGGPADPWPPPAR